METLNVATESLQPYDTTSSNLPSLPGEGILSGEFLSE